MRCVNVVLVSLLWGAMYGMISAGFLGPGVGVVAGLIVALASSPITAMCLWRKQSSGATKAVFVPTLVVALLLAIFLPGVGALFCIAFYVAACIVAGLVLPNVWPPRAPHVCVECGYDLRGLLRRVCPECGRAFGSISGPTP